MAADHRAPRTCAAVRAQAPSHGEHRRAHLRRVERLAATTSATRTKCRTCARRSSSSTPTRRAADPAGDHGLSTGEIARHLGINEGAVSTRLFRARTGAGAPRLGPDESRGRMTMEHAEFRRLFGADPKRTEPEVLAHRASCAECAKYAADLERVDQMVAGALDAPRRKPTETLGSERRFPGSRSRRACWWWSPPSPRVGGQRRDALFTELLKHANGERNVHGQRQARQRGKVRLTLAKAGARMASSMPFSTRGPARCAASSHRTSSCRPRTARWRSCCSRRNASSPHSSRTGCQGRTRAHGQPFGGRVRHQQGAVEQGSQLASRSIEWVH